MDQNSQQPETPLDEALHTALHDQKFANFLKEKCPNLKIIFHNEMFSTSEAKARIPKKH